MKIRTYSELMRIPEFIDRFRYLKLTGEVGVSTFGFDRYLNQILYTSQKWRRTRNGIIIRDNGCDLGVPDYEIENMIIIHHMNPLTIDDIEDDNPAIYDPEFLISTAPYTHNAIHFGDEKLLPKLPVERRPNDMCPWR